MAVGKWDWWLRGVARGLRMVQATGIAAVATGEADGNDVEFGRTVLTPRVFVDGLAVDLGWCRD